MIIIIIVIIIIIITIIINGNKSYHKYMKTRLMDTSHLQNTNLLLVPKICIYFWPSTRNVSKCVTMAVTAKTALTLKFSSNFFWRKPLEFLIII